MCKKIFIAATGQHCGKTTVCLSLMHLARRKYGRVGFIKPLGPKCVSFAGRTMDKDAVLMARIYGLEQDAHLMSPLVLPSGSTKDYLDGRIDHDAQVRRITQACEELEKRCDFLIIEGSGHGGVGSVVGLSNARMARLLEAPVVMVTSGGIGNVIDSVLLNRALYDREGAEVRMLLVNKLLTEKKEGTLSYLRRAFEGSGIQVKPAFDYSPVLANPTMQNLSGLLGKPLHGDPTGRNRIVHHIQLGAASSQKVIDGLQDSTLLITTSSRDELLVTTSSLYHIPSYRTKIAGLVIPGHAPISPITQKILDDSNIPYIRIETTTADAFTMVSDHVSKITADDEEKLLHIRTAAETQIDFEAVDAIAG
ncbi:MAG TPA: AAA family ATPase [Verrucomicrobiae bacterium]|nr:AAA family ATPase [Verrucomicrobiae bacterium]